MLCVDGTYLTREGKESSVRENVCGVDRGSGRRVKRVVCVCVWMIPQEEGERE